MHSRSERCKSDQRGHAVQGLRRYFEMSVVRNLRLADCIAGTLVLEMPKIDEVDWIAAARRRIELG